MNKRKKILSLICQAYQIQILYAFGSRANQMTRWINGELDMLPANESDGDIGIKPANPLTVQQKVLLTQALEDMFTLSRIDLIILSCI